MHRSPSHATGLQSAAPVEAQPYLRAAQAAARYGIARSTFWLYVKEGKLPQPIKFGPRIRVWKAEELDQAFERFGSTAPRAA
jgi:prophage regulatory protein